MGRRGGPHPGQSREASAANGARAGGGGPRRRNAAAERRCACAERPPCPSESARGDGAAGNYRAPFALMAAAGHRSSSQSRRRSPVTPWHLQSIAVPPTALGGPRQPCTGCEAPHCHRTALHLPPAEAPQLLPGRCAPAVTRPRPPSRHRTECAAPPFKCYTAPLAYQPCPALHSQAAAATRQCSPGVLPSPPQHSICPCRCLRPILQLLQTLPALHSQQGPPQPLHGSAPPPACVDQSRGHGPLQLPFHSTAQVTPHRQCSLHGLPAMLHLLTAQLPCEHSSTGASLHCTLPTALPSFLLAPQPSNAP